MPRPATVYLPAAIAASLSLLLASPAAAQGRTAPGPAKAGVITFAEDVYRVESIGLSMNLPEGATAQLTREGGKVKSTILAPDQTWIINIESRESKSLDLSLGEVIDAIQQQVLASVGVENAEGTLISTRGTVLDRQRNLALKGGPAERVYIVTPAVSGPATLRGYTAFNPSPGKYVTFELLTPEPGHKSVLPIYEAILATVAFEDPAIANAARQQAVAAGISYFAQLTNDDYRAILDRKNEQRWQRLYERSSTGADDKELGYRRMTTWLGKRGELDSSRDRSKWTAADQQSGYLMKLEARILDGSVIYDTVSVFFLAEDRSTEAWLVRGSRKENGRTSTWTEIGARDGDSMTVRIDPPNGPSQTVKPLIEGEGYLSRLESALLPEFLMRRRIPTEYGFYVYQSDTATIRLRRDVLDEAENRAGLWTLTTKLSDDAAPQTTLLNERGEQVRTDLAENRVWEPIELNRLVSIWRRNNLPMD